MIQSPTNFAPFFQNWSHWPHHNKVCNLFCWALFVVLVMRLLRSSTMFRSLVVFSRGLTRVDTEKGEHVKWNYDVSESVCWNPSVEEKKIHTLFPISASWDTVYWTLLLGHSLTIQQFNNKRYLHLNLFYQLHYSLQHILSVFTMWGQK